MRETWAKAIVLFTGLLVLLLAYLFAHNQNMPGVKSGDAPIPMAKSLDEHFSEQELKNVDAGRVVFNREGCLICHSLEGKGNPSNSLEGVGKKLTISELRQWITATNGSAEKLPRSIVNRKNSYLKLSQQELDDLVFYLQHQK